MTRPFPPSHAARHTSITTWVSVQFRRLMNLLFILWTNNSRLSSYWLCYVCLSVMSVTSVCDGCWLRGTRFETLESNFDDSVPMRCIWVTDLLVFLFILVMVSCNAPGCNWERTTDSQGLSRHHTACLFHKRASTLANQRRHTRAREAVASNFVSSSSINTSEPVSDWLWELDVTVDSLIDLRESQPFGMWGTVWTWSQCLWPMEYSVSPLLPQRTCTLMTQRCSKMIILMLRWGTILEMSWTMMQVCVFQM